MLWPHKLSLPDLTECTEIKESFLGGIVRDLIQVTNSGLAGRVLVDSELVIIASGASWGLAERRKF